MALGWGARRQLLIVSGILGIIILIAGIILYPKFNQAPTCFDGKMNGTEQGIDCGGACQRICASQTADVVVKWARPFQVTKTVASVIAYIENPNVHAAARDVPYQFKLYDSDHQFIAERSGTTYIAPNGTSAIFEGGIQVGSRVPVFVSFNFTSDPLWVAVDPRIDTIRVIAHDSLLTDADTKPRLGATITNTSQLYSLDNVDVIGILYDANDNAVGASQTIVQGLGPQTYAPVYFTWQQPFSSPAVRNEIITRYDVFSVNFQ